MARPKFKVGALEAKTLSWWKARRSKIDMDPPYQRRGRLWSPTDKAYLIDSIINAFDVPKLYVADFSFGDSSLNKRQLQYAIIDGKQRFEAIFDFYDGNVVLNQDFVYLENQNLKLGGLGYRDLQENYPEIAENFDTFNLAVMSVVTDSAELINDLFVRLNRSKPLTGAEIRNAMSGPAPEVIRDLAKSEFFQEFISFQVQRGQDLNSAAKLLLFEFNDKPSETKKSNLDVFVKSAGRNRNQLELAARRAHSMLATLTGIFLPRDALLHSAGTLPVYYWFIRSLKENHYPLVREFLVRTEEERKLNRSGTGTLFQEVWHQKDLTELDQFNRSTNDLASHLGRIQILERRFSRFVNKGKSQK